MSQYKKRLNGSLKILSGNAIDINMDEDTEKEGNPSPTSPLST